MRLALYAAASALLVSGVSAHADTTYDITTTNVIYGGDISGTISGSGLTLGSFDITVSDGKTDFVFDSSSGSSGSVMNSNGTLANDDPIYEILIVDPSSDYLFLYFTGDFTDGLTAVASTAQFFQNGMLLNGAFVYGYTLEPGEESMSEGAGGNDSYAAVVPSAATPEPSSLVLLGTGALGVFGAVRRRLA